MSEIHSMMLKRRQAIPETVQMNLTTGAVDVVVRQHARAKHYRLSLHPKKGVVLTVPKRGNWRDAQDFLSRHQTWLNERMDQIAPPTLLAPDMSVPLRGVPHQLARTGNLRGLVELDETNSQINVPGAPDHFARKLGDWLKAQARQDLEKQVQFHAARLELSPKGITIRDQTSRWGSCSSSGQLNFSWRLVLAPPYVLDYVAAHEVAHLREMNHSARFWRTVKETLPDMDRGHDWLKVHGRELMRFQIKG
ncbi:M48 family metallopeptidase [Maritalea sp. P4.10X]|uniref:M48 family metallopeptidase n=1 Tax=Maritalea mediterranea TaxID=2909667 RepID=A0ABS9E2E7_9HYPH|nr:M48 family metallopeptidase [Maritalea mediterranea]